MWCYSQTSGRLFHNGVHLFTAYSGFGPGRNNPAMQAVHNVGPIPQGEYDFGTPHDSNEMGPYVTALIPNDHNAFGRSGFYLHGDNSYHDASHGCIVISPRSSREEIVRDGGPIVVVATDDDVEGTLQ